LAALKASVLPDGFSASTVGSVSEETELALEEVRNLRRKPSNRGEFDRSRALVSVESRDVEPGPPLVPPAADEPMILDLCMYENLCGSWSRVTEHVSAGHGTFGLQRCLSFCEAYRMDMQSLVNSCYGGRNMVSRGGTQTDLFQVLPVKFARVDNAVVDLFSAESHYSPMRHQPSFFGLKHSAWRAVLLELRAPV
jgi:hypothetical protein